MKVDIDEITKYGLTIQVYLDLKYLYFTKIGGEELFVNNYGRVEPFKLYRYETLGFIKTIGNDYQLRNSMRDLFEGEKDLFLKWFSMFPLKTPTGRYLRPKDDDTITGKKLRQKWNKHFKNNTIGAKKAITVLDAEMSMRRQTGKFEYMHNAETWLNKGDYEIYAELLEKKETISTKRREDYE
tara:strand:+ start:1206 stop:1754 length:549 start_codon:yes stop_codon:yes gene_type:complete